MLPSGKQATYVNRVGWARTHLAKAGALENPTKGRVKITSRGQALIDAHPRKLSTKELQVYPEFAQFWSSGKTKTETAPKSLSNEESVLSPEEQLQALYEQLNTALTDELLKQVLSLTPQQFEVLVVQLLVAMGYGGSVRDAGQALGRSGDNGIDGLVKQDPLGLDRVYVQAKQWTTNVGSQEVRNFSGSLTYYKASKGVLMTTAGFSSSAKETAKQIGNIILIDGALLAELMIQYNIGVLTRETYHLKKIDSDFFEGI